MYLLDTNVISEFRKARPHPAVLRWLEAQHEHAIFVSAITLGEIQAGIEITRPQDAPKAEEIEGWLDEIERTYQVLPMDGTLFRSWARWMHGRSDHLYEDAMLAVTALAHGLVLVTRNVRDFESFPVKVLNPFEEPL